MPRNDDPMMTFQKILESITWETWDEEHLEVLKKVFLWFHSLVPLYNLLDQKEFQQWNEIFDMTFPEEEE